MPPSGHKCVPCSRDANQTKPWKQTKNTSIADVCRIALWVMVGKGFRGGKDDLRGG